MKTVPITLFLLALCFSFTAIAGGNDNIKTMAKIMSSLNHYPGDMEKKTLKTVADKGSAFEKVLAQSMIHLEHHAAPADKSKLQAIIDDKSASANEKDLAKIILNLNHKPTDADKAKLTAMMQ